MADYDGVWKRLFQSLTDKCLSDLCGVDATDCKITELPTEYTKAVRADLVYEVMRPDGESTIVHIEVQSHNNPTFERRLVLYWAMLFENHGRPPHQIVILPRRGLKYAGRYDTTRLKLTYDVVDVTAMDPETLLRTELAPLALAASRHPGKLVGPVLERIAALPLSEDQRAALLDLAILAAGDDLLAPITESLRRHNMSNLLERIPEVRAFAARAAAEAAAEGRATGCAEGQAKGRAEAIRVLLVDRFGDRDDLDAIAQHMAGDDLATSIHRVRDAETLDELRP